MRITDGTRRARLTFALDLLAIAAFVLLGMREHRSGTTVVVFVRTAGPVLVAWLLCSLLFRTYRPPSHRSLVKTILVAVPAGILLRTAIVGSPEGWGILTFLLVALVFLSLLLGTARVVASALSRRLERGTA
jgi:DUF3054 family protein